MDFRQQESDFREIDRLYEDLARQRESGAISEIEFESRRQQLMVLDSEGRWWSKSPEGGAWHYHDGANWVKGTPPVYRADDPKRDTGRKQAADAAAGGGASRRRVWPWLLAVVILLVGLAGIGLIVWPLVPGNLPTFGLGGDGGSGQGGTGFDAAFVHRATAENVSANNTFLDNPAINDNPDAIIYVTQRWNPDGGEGIYNDHPVGVWYDEGDGRWAVFNEDREAMPEGVAFNVFVLESPPE